MSKPRPQWADAAPRCQCGRDLTHWHPTAQAREFVRVYGDEAGRVPACPGCVTCRDGREGVIESVPVAMKHARDASSVEADRVRLEREAMRG